jgi:maltose O-acetyltransferase
MVKELLKARRPHAPAMLFLAPLSSSAEIDQVRRALLLALYYGLFQYLPASRRLWRVPGILRHWCCKGLFAYCGPKANIERRAFIGYGKDIRLGANSGIGVRATMPPGVTIGDDVMMGEDVVFITQNHAYRDSQVLIREQGYCPVENIAIEDDVWIGSRVIILPGVTVGRGAVIGAGAVVTKNVQPYAVVAGNPARVVGRREP